MGKLAEKRKVSEDWPERERTWCSFNLCAPIQIPMLDEIVNKNHSSYCGSNYLQSRWCNQLAPLHNHVRHDVPYISLAA
jgi:hypothetical protein